MSSEVVASDLYQLVYQFLIACGHTKSARVFLKDTNKDVHDFGSSVNEDLVTIYKEYKDKRRDEETQQNKSTKRKRKDDESPVSKAEASQHENLPNGAVGKKSKKSNKSEEYDDSSKVVTDSDISVARKKSKKDGNDNLSKVVIEPENPKTSVKKNESLKKTKISNDLEVSNEPILKEKSNNKKTSSIPVQEKQVQMKETISTSKKNTLKASKPVEPESSSEEESSDEDEDSDESSDEEEEEEEKVSQKKKKSTSHQPKEAKTVSAAVTTKSKSVTASQPAVQPKTVTKSKPEVVVKLAAVVAKKVEESSDDDDDDDESDDDDEEEEEEDDDDEDDDGEEEDDESESDESESEDEEAEQRKEEERLRLKELEKRRKSAEAAAAAAKWMENAGKSPMKSNGSKAKDRTSTEGRKSGEAFKRVDAEQWSKEIVTGLEDNSYEKVFGADGYGAKASTVLQKVRGKDFRHEKTKKKRGSYRGGSISLESNSFKYDD